MQITIKLYAMLSEYLPSNSVRNVGNLDLPTGATVDTVIQQLQLPEQYVHLVLVNGLYISHEERATTSLKDGDALAIWPPVAGG